MVFIILLIDCLIVKRSLCQMIDVNGRNAEWMGTRSHPTLARLFEIHGYKTFDQIGKLNEKKRFKEFGSILSRFYISTRP